MSMLGTSNIDYDSFRAVDADKDVVKKEIRTKQSFKDSCDVNKIIKKAQITGSLAHAQKYDTPVYGDFTGIDLIEAQAQCGS